ncbi:hypothetical protein DIZ27_12175 [Streptomyces sp. NWU339]|uniref:hypothetical protein n=1 Tax=Streptomyces sp. NWU339 TaxID=2185284 RepID=UPI000D6847A1|nr:hypothetical protein [Streptomyces sp. NWU339]PWI10365.1 hypothetical protein DIZ27_12175 [Streptomyces sp. NWU339]
MSLIPLVLGVGIVLGGLALATDHRGVAQRVVDTQLNPAYTESGILRGFSRLGREHPGMDFSRNAPRLRMLVRIWGGIAVVAGLGFLAVGVALLVRA